MSETIAPLRPIDDRASEMRTISGKQRIDLSQVDVVGGTSDERAEPPLAQPVASEVEGLPPPRASSLIPICEGTLQLPAFHLGLPSEVELAPVANDTTTRSEPFHLEAAATHAPPSHARIHRAQREVVAAVALFAALLGLLALSAGAVAMTLFR